MAPIQFSIGRLLVCLAILGFFLAFGPLRFVLFSVGRVIATLVVLILIQAPLTYLLWRLGWLPERPPPRDE